MQERKKYFLKDLFLNMVKFTACRNRSAMIQKGEGTSRSERVWEKGAMFFRISEGFYMHQAEFWNPKNSFMSVFLCVCFFVCCLFIFAFVSPYCYNILVAYWIIRVLDTLDTLASSIPWEGSISTWYFFHVEVQLKCNLSFASKILYSKNKTRTNRDRMNRAEK